MVGALIDRLLFLCSVPKGTGRRQAGQHFSLCRMQHELSYRHFNGDGFGQHLQKLLIVMIEGPYRRGSPSG